MKQSVALVGVQTGIDVVLREDIIYIQSRERKLVVKTIVDDIFKAYGYIVTA